MPRGLQLAVLSAALFGASSASSAEPFDVGAPAPAPPAPGGTEQATVSRYWELGRPRSFLAADVEAGYAYVRPKFSAGFGQPYWRWIGVEAHPIVSTGGAGQYMGVQGALPFLSLRLGARYYYPFSRSMLRPRANYSRNDIELLEGPRADYLALQAEVNATIPAPIGSVFALANLYQVRLVPDGYYLYEESLRSVMEPPWIWRARLGYLVGIGRERAIRLGVAGDLIGLPGRGEFVVRAGILGSVAINAHLDAQASFIPVWLSPDNLGLAGGDFGQLGVRLRWATGSTPVAPAKGKALPRTSERSADERR